MYLSLASALYTMFSILVPILLIVIVLLLKKNSVGVLLFLL